MDLVVTRIAGGKTYPTCARPDPLMPSTLWVRQGPEHVIHLPRSELRGENRRNKGDDYIQRRPYESARTDVWRRK